MIVLSVVVCVAAAGWLGVQLIDTDSTSASADGRPTATAPSPSATAPSPTASDTTEPEPTEPEPTDEGTAEEPERTAPVSVLNNTGIANLATTYAARVRDAGWTISGVGNWRGQIVSNTVYYPSQLEQQARLLADDLDIQRILPRIAPMKSDRITIILSGPQQ